MEFLSQIWVWIIGILGGISYTGIIGAVIYGCLRGAFNKTISKINTEKIVEEVVNKAVDKVKSVSFKQNIQPLVESELMKVNEKSNEHIELAYAKVKAKIDKLVNVMENLASYFDNSIAVTDEAKEKLHKSIAEAKDDIAKDTEITVDEIIIEETPQVIEEPKTKVKRTKIER